PYVFAHPDTLAVLDGWGSSHRARWKHPPTEEGEGCRNPKEALALLWNEEGSASAGEKWLGQGQGEGEAQGAGRRVPSARVVKTAGVVVILRECPRVPPGHVAPVTPELWARAGAGSGAGVELLARVARLRLLSGDQGPLPRPRLVLSRVACESTTPSGPHPYPPICISDDAIRVSLRSCWELGGSGGRGNRGKLPVVL
ncbi:unnamed protein product, partial [Discosporangium mesarthrocarpum]